MSEWIKTADRVPEDDRHVLCYQKGRLALLPLIAWYDTETKKFQVSFTWQETLIDADYWMYFPEPPEEPTVECTKAVKQSNGTIDPKFPKDWGKVK